MVQRCSRPASAASQARVSQTAVAASVGRTELTREKRADFETVEHGQPHSEHGSEQQSLTEMDRTAAARIESAAELFAAEAGGLDSGQLSGGPGG